MANIRSKSIKDLTAWDLKELRKLKITTKNRIASLKAVSPKDLKDDHPLFGFDVAECEGLLQKIHKSEKALTKD